ncbi:MULTISPECIES: hypothetical protein [Psychrobacter]|uniref:hypothetical protein n=2 Tax=Gammaproteobacteria TaxID=1236 RepID=UPI0004284C43|nr:MULTISPECIES: hypothetical protein [Psychrobacter]
MLNSTTATSELGYLADELVCYLQAAASEIVLPNLQTIEARYEARQYHYRLPLGKLQLLTLTVTLPSETSLAKIESVRMAAVKAALAWHKSYTSQSKDAQLLSYDVLIVDIQFGEYAKSSDNNDSDNNSDSKINIENNRRSSDLVKRVTHEFAARYFMEDLVVDISDSGQQLQIFSWHDWCSIMLALQTPCELWRFLGYHLEQLQQSVSSHIASFESEERIIRQFLSSVSLFNHAITVDNALIKYGIQQAPNSALIAMSLAQKNQSKTAPMYEKHMAQAATLWSQLSAQMIHTVSAELKAKADKESITPSFSVWQQQLLDESLFSRHELIRTLYRHPKQQQALQKTGYVVHQHSYENLGRHYVLIFYGQDGQGQNSKAAIQPNLQQIAQDVATRLPMAELHHVIVLGIDFISEAGETFIDIDLWIQPMNSMTQRERQLTKQIQRLKQQGTEQPTSKKLTQQANDLPQVRLNLSIPARKDKP